MYDEEKLKNDAAINYGRTYQQCAVSVMDTIADPDIYFDEKGICNYFYEYKKAINEFVFTGEVGKRKTEEAVAEIKKVGKGKKYDCIVGLSGGVDSTYLAYLAKELNLKPLAVHFDYGWNSELATHNIKAAIEKLNIDLYTYVIDWEDFKELLRSYFKAGVLDLDVPADQLIFGALYKIAKKFGIKYILSGNNVTTEFVLPKTWNYDKFDWINLRNIQNRFGSRNLKNLPKLGYYDFLINTFVRKIKRIPFLNYIEYNKEAVTAFLKEKLGWRDYGGKHHESIFTRFYQGYILPVRFGIDKRKAHLSTLIFSGQITKEQALHELEKPTYDLTLQKQDYEYVAKKLDFSIEEFAKMLSQPIVEHSIYGTDQKQRERTILLKNILTKAIGVKKI